MADININFDFGKLSGSAQKIAVTHLGSGKLRENNLLVIWQRYYGEVTIFS